MGFGLRCATSYNLLHVGTERLKRIWNATNTVEKKLEQRHADFCQEFESQLQLAGLIMPKS